MKTCEQLMKEIEEAYRTYYNDPYRPVRFFYDCRNKWSVKDGADPVQDYETLEDALADIQRWIEDRKNL